MFVRRCLTISLSAFLWCSVVFATNASNGIPPELKWARGIADDFWEAMIDGDCLEAAGLLSPELARSYRAIELDRAAGYHLSTLIQRIHGIQSVSISSAEMAPDRSEAIFRGMVTGEKQGSDPEVKQDFTMRVAKEPGGRWSIRFLRLKEHQEKAKKSRGK